MQDVEIKRVSRTSASVSPHPRSPNAYDLGRSGHTEWSANDPLRTSRNLSTVGAIWIVTRSAYVRLCLEETIGSMSELTLDEMLADPIVHLMMARDGVREIEVRELIGRTLRRHIDRGPAGSRPEIVAISRAA